jgi:hypothetical protein
LTGSAGLILLRDGYIMFVACSESSVSGSVDVFSCRSCKECRN